MAHFKVFSLIFDVISSAETPLARYSYLNLYEGLFSRETQRLLSAGESKNRLAQNARRFFLSQGFR